MKLNALSMALFTSCTVIILASSLVLAKESTSVHASADACSALKGESIGGARITDAAMIPAGKVAATRYTSSGDVPAYCKVDGLIPPKLKFELRLPVDWNGKFYFRGSGGYGGVIFPIDPAVLTQGYATVASNTGHDADPMDISFALNDATAKLQLAQLSVPMVAAAAKEIVEGFYGKAPERSYFEGCSNGGREGVMTALRFPTVFDGIIAGAPGIQEVGIQTYMQQAFRAIHAPGGMISANKLKMLNDAVLKQCDTVEADGLVDGIVSNWEACRFDPVMLRCPDGADTGDTCLSDTQLHSIRMLTEPRTAAKGAIHFPGYPLVGTQGLPGEWDTWLFAKETRQFDGITSALKYLFAKNPEIDPLNWDIEENALTVELLHDLFDVSDPNLQSFTLAGGKLIMWTGAGDPTVAVDGVTNYYKEVISTLGKNQADASLRLYVMGGVGHCRGGSGADRVQGLLPALDAWVAEGKEPENLVATKAEPETNKELFSRPLCNYPAYARYKGEGNVNNASSFSCEAP